MKDILDYLKKLFSQGKNKLVEEYVKEHSEEEDIDDIAFLAAVQTGNIDYIQNHAFDIDLNNEEAGRYSSYIYETDDPIIQRVLFNCGAFRKLEDYDDCSFVFITNTGALNLTAKMHKAVYRKLLESLGVSEKKFVELVNAEMFDEDLDIEQEPDWFDQYSLEDICEMLHLEINDDNRVELVEFEPYEETDLYELPELLESLGFDVQFDGEYNRRGNNGVFFIK